MRRVLNIAYGALAQGLDAAGRSNLDYELRLKFDHEMTREELRREEYRREAIRIGAIDGQNELMRAFDLGQAGTA